MKVREQGNDLVLTVPAKFNIEKNSEFIAMKGTNGSIVYVPKIKNVFQEAASRGDSLREAALNEEYDFEKE